MARREMAREIADRCIAIRTRRAERLVSRLYDEALRPLGMTAGQLSLLVAIELLGAPQQVELAQRLNLEKSTVSRNLGRMLANGWIKDVSSPGVRARQVCLTSAGGKCLVSAYPVWKNAQERARLEMGPERVDALFAG